MDKQGVINRDVNAVARASQAVSLRAQKLTFEEIAHRCGYKSPGACRNAIQRELQRTIVKNVEELRTEELAMLDLLHKEVWELAIDKKNKGRLLAIDRILSISERRCKLMGLDIKPDEQLTQQNYTKQIILTHTSIEVQS